MRKTYSKAGMFIVMACFCMTISGLFATGAAQASPVSRHHHHTHHKSLSKKSLLKPHIVVKLLPNSVHYFHNQYVARAIVYGYGFDDCNSCTTPPSDCNCTAPSYTSPSYTSPSYTPPSNTTPSDTTPPPTNTTPPVNTSPCANGCTTTTSHEDINDKVTTTDVKTAVITTTTTTTTTNTTESNQSLDCVTDCAPAPILTPPAPTPTPTPAPSTVPNATNSGTGCPSYNSCGSTPNNCSCGTTASLQGNVPFFAPGVNFARIPVDSYGQFRIGVNVRLPHRFAQTRPAFWATSSYNAQRSDNAFLPSATFCCQ